MRDLRVVLGFAWPYLRRYGHRFLCGVLLGVLFGMLNGVFVGASTFLFSRFIPYQFEAASTASVTMAGAMPAWIASIKLWVTGSLDAWLPHVGRPLEWQQIIGGFSLLPILALLRGLAGYGSSYCMAWTSQRIITDLKQDVFSKLSAQSLDFFNRSTTGDLLNRVNQDTTALLNCLRIGLSDLIKEPITLLSVFATLWWLDWQLTLLALVFLPLVALPTRIIRRKVRQATHANLNASIAQDNLLIESLSGIRVLQAFGLIGRRQDEFSQRNREAGRAGLKIIQTRDTLNPAIETLGALGMGVVIIFLFVTQRSVANLMGFIVGLTLFYAPLKKLMSVHVYFTQARLPVARLSELFDMQPSIQNRSNAKPAPNFASSVVFDRVSFQYEAGGIPALENFSLELRRGSRIGLAGPSGSGKSTVVNLLLRFYDPTSGVVKLDGVDLRDLQLADLRRQVALVSQEIVLFNTTAAENIALGRPQATFEEIEQAARQAFAHEFIQEMPEGYQTVLGERGVRLSGGQRQRLAIARAFIRNAPILVLDEATAALDSNAEAEVQAALDLLARERTVLAIAHRLATLAPMDLILVLEAGQVVEQGTFQELLARGGLFAKMADQQGFKKPR